jgi:hypothetical protein
MVSTYNLIPVPIRNANKLGIIQNWGSTTMKRGRRFTENKREKNIVKYKRGFTNSFRNNQSIPANQGRRSVIALLGKRIAARMPHNTVEGGLLFSLFLALQGRQGCRVSGLDR